MAVATHLVNGPALSKSSKTKDPAASRCLTRNNWIYFQDLRFFFAAAHELFPLIVKAINLRKLLLDQGEAVLVHFVYAL